MVATMARRRPARAALSEPSSADSSSSSPSSPSICRRRSTSPAAWPAAGAAIANLVRMRMPARLVPLLEQFDWACGRLLNRLTGPVGDSGDGSAVEIPPLTDAEYLWEPVPGCWSIRRRSFGPGERATLLVGAGEWGRDAAGSPHPWPPPFATLAWRLGHLSEMLALRAEYTNGAHSATRDTYAFPGDAAGGLKAFQDGSAAWRFALQAADEKALDTVGHSQYPYGSDPETPFLEVVWWVNQEVLHHGAEIALLRDLWRDLPNRSYVP
jgi:hypothetical protein